MVSVEEHVVVEEEVCAQAPLLPLVALLRLFIAVLTERGFARQVAAVAVSACAVAILQQ